MLYPQTEYAVHLSLSTWKPGINAFSGLVAVGKKVE